MTDFTALIRLLSENEVEFIIVGGAAATAHGSARLTLDLDVVYNRSSANVESISGLPFEWSVETIQKGLSRSKSPEWSAAALGSSA